MKSTFLALFVFFFGLTVLAKPDSEALKKALESQPTCSNSVRFDDQYLYLGFGQYRKLFEEPRSPIPATLQVVSIQDPTQGFTLSTSDAAIDSLSMNDSLFILTYSGIEEWSLAQKKQIASFDTYAYPGTMEYMQHAQAFARYGDKVIVAHGRLGVSFFNLKTRRLLNQFRLVQSQLPLESMATGVTVQGKFALVVMDNFSLVSQGKPAFRGIIVIDMESESVVSELDGLDPGADSILGDGKKVIVSFGGIPIWKYLLNSLSEKSLPEPENRVWHFDVNGHPTGSPSMDEKYYYTCYLKAPLKSGGKYTKVPLALDRRILMLD